MPDSEHLPIIRLDQFLKLHGLAGTGGQAKIMIQNGEIEVNGQPETRRGRKLRDGDIVTMGGKEFVVTVGQ